jgi:hypothetical protein
MLCGGALYAAAYPVMKSHIINIGSYGKIGLPQVTGLNHWIVIILLAALSALLFRFFEKNRL